MANKFDGMTDMEIIHSCSSRRPTKDGLFSWVMSDEEIEAGKRRYDECMKELERRELTATHPFRPLDR